MKKRIQSEIDAFLHYDMTFLGGFLGTYAMLLRSGNLGSAQTGNFLEIMISVSEKNLTEVGIRLGAAGIYALAMILSYIMTNYTDINMKTMVLKVEMVGLAVVAWIPVTVHPIIALYPVFAMMSFQWGTYTGAKGYTSASIFTTNNFKQCVLGWTKFVLTHDPKAKEQAELFTFTVVSFVFGALIGAIAVEHFGTFASFAGYFPLILAFILNRSFVRE